MNILHINNFHYWRGGSEAVYFKTAELLEEHKHSSLFFSVNHPNTVSCKTEQYFIPFMDFNVSQGMTEQLKSAVRVLYSFQARKYLSRLLDRFDVDIAHLHNIYHHISPSVIHELKKKRIPIVMTLHDYKMVCPAYALLRNGKTCEACEGGRYFHALKDKCIKKSIAKTLLAVVEMYLHHSVLRIYDSVDVFISPSMFLIDKLKEMGFRKNIVYLPNFINSRDFMGFRSDASSKEKSIVYFGRLSFEKGLWTLLEAAKLFREDAEYQNIKIKIIGDGSEMRALKNMVESEQIDNVRFYGVLKGNDLFSEISNSISAVLPSEWYENNPVSVLESFALATPVIGARIGGIPELVRDGETGLLFEPGDAAGLCSKMKFMICNTDKAYEMGLNGRGMVRDEFNPDKYYHQLMKIYNSTLSSA